MEKQKEICIGDMKQIIVDIMSWIDALCRENKIVYYLTMGSLLGAVRHQGFIPWDDDLDITMPRDSYQRFLKLCMSLKNSRYKLVCIENEPSYHLPFAKVIDSQTILIEKTRNTIELGVYVDIFPMDYLGNDYKCALKLNNRINVYRKILNSKAFFWNPKRRWYRNMASIFVSMIPVSRKYLIERIDRMSRFFEEQRDSQYVANMVWMFYGKKEIMPSVWYGQPLELLFEGKSFFVPQNYDDVLKNFYGNYMQLPPIEDQVSHHDYSVYYKL